MTLPKIKLLQNNFYSIDLPNGEIYISYETPVAVRVCGKGIFRRGQFYSNTTSRHINKWCYGFAKVDEVEFTALISEVLGEAIRTLSESPEEKFKRFLDIH